MLCNRPQCHTRLRYFELDHLELAMFPTKISSAPQLARSSITVAIFTFSTMTFTATQSGSSSAVTVGARLPGVILVAVGRSFRGML